MEENAAFNFDISRFLADETAQESNPVGLVLDVLEKEEDHVEQYEA